MGQAKSRGTFEERRAAAIERDAKRIEEEEAFAQQLLAAAQGSGATIEDRRSDGAPESKVLNWGRAGALAAMLIGLGEPPVAVERPDYLPRNPRGRG